MAFQAKISGNDDDIGGHRFPPSDERRLKSWACSIRRLPADRGEVKSGWFVCRRPGRLAAEQYCEVCYQFFLQARCPALERLIVLMCFKGLKVAVCLLQVKGMRVIWVLKKIESQRSWFMISADFTVPFQKIDEFLVLPGLSFHSKQHAEHKRS
jgi:hypothetical protein